MSFLLDTNVLSAYLKGGYPKLQSKYLQHGGQLYTSAINVGELCVWAQRSTNSPARLQDISDLLQHVRCLSVDLSIAEKFGAVRAQQIAAGTPTPALDLFIACTALVYNFTLVTHNVADFTGIPGLRVVDWLSG